MKRDMDLIREILLKAESDMPCNDVHTFEPKDFPSHDFEIVESHVNLLLQIGYLRSCDRVIGIDSVDFSGLSWQGYNFLESIRDNKIWKKTKDAANKAGGFTVELLGDIALGLIKAQIKNHTGVEV